MTQDVTLEVAGARVTLPAATITNLWLERVRGEKHAAFAGQQKIGGSFHGLPGIYAGLVVGDDDSAADYHLVVLDGDRDNLTWEEAKAWAQSVGGELPKRKEQAVLFGNAPHLFEKDWYWSCEQSASYSDYAWGQTFYGGIQYYDRKGSRFRARAVRRFEI